MCSNDDDDKSVDTIIYIVLGHEYVDPSSAKMMMMTMMAL